MFFYISIFIVVALDLSSRLHFSVLNIEKECDLYHLYHEISRDVQDLH